MSPQQLVTLYSTLYGSSDDYDSALDIIMFLGYSDGDLSLSNTPLEWLQWIEDNEDEVNDEAWCLRLAKLKEELK